MTAGTAAARGREAYERQAWGTARELFLAADRESPLSPEDLERAGHAVYLAGYEDDAYTLFERAFHERLSRGDAEGAALDGFWLVYGLMTRGEWARAGGWLTRAREAIDGGRRDCLARGYLLAPDALRSLMSGQAQTAYEMFSEQRAIGRRFADADLITLAGFGQGQALMQVGRVAEGMTLLDEVMLGITAGEVRPIVAGLVYCGVIATCMQALDLARAQEWTAALTGWCEAQPELVPFRGQCSVHRAQILQLHGDWTGALEELQRAGERFAATGHPAIGDALYEQGEVHRLRGDLDAAEQAFHRAGVLGRDTQPGLALLRLAQRRVGAATAGIRRAIEEAVEPGRRAPLLSACVEIALESGDVAWARAASDELGGLERDRDVPLLAATTALCQGEVALAEGDPRAALGSARLAWSLWQDLEAPYPAARARVVVGRACRQMGDEDAARMEFDAARHVFERLSAGPDLRRVLALAGRPTRGADQVLTDREVEVLRLIATGRTNRAIAGELVLSEKTVARHVSNILAKLRLPSRAAATAYAYEHDLL